MKKLFLCLMAATLFSHVPASAAPSLQTIKQKTKERKKEIALVVGIAAVAVIAFLARRHFRSPIVPPFRPNQPDNPGDFIPASGMQYGEILAAQARDLNARLPRRAAPPVQPPATTEGTGRMISMVIDGVEILDEQAVIRSRFWPEWSRMIQDNDRTALSNAGLSEHAVTILRQYQNRQSNSTNQTTVTRNVTTNVHIAPGAVVIGYGNVRIGDRTY